MRLIYGSGDHFFKIAAFHIDVWLDRTGRLLARFWSRGSDVENLSLEIHGITADSIPFDSKGVCISDAWLPKVVRAAYEKWVISNMPFRNPPFPAGKGRVINPDQA
jgi:hypothetical protein